jgi:integrase
VIAAMPRIRPPYLQRHTTRHGKPAWYVKYGRNPLIRIRGEYGSDEFMANYEAALRGERPETSAKRSAKVGTLEWLIARYRETPAWLGLSLATRRQRENIFKQIIKVSGREPYTALNERSIVAGRDRRGKTPAQARHFIDTLRGLLDWAKEAQFVKFNAAAGVKYPQQKKTQGFPVWTEDDIAKYEKRWPLGTKERVWLSVLLYTGLRRGDAVKLGRQHVRDGIATIRTEKSQGEIEVTIPILPVLAAALKRGPTGELAFICGDKGKPFTKESFGNAFSEACRLAGVNKSAHGVRKAGATRAANNGATVAQLEAIFGWVGGRMASHYTRSADRVRLAKEAIGKLANEARTSIVLPDDQVRVSRKK